MAPRGDKGKGEKIERGQGGYLDVRVRRRGGGVGDEQLVTC